MVCTRRTSCHFMHTHAGQQQAALPHSPAKHISPGTSASKQQKVKRACCRRAAAAPTAPSTSSATRRSTATVSGV